MITQVPSLRPVICISICLEYLGCVISQLTLESVRDISGSHFDGSDVVESLRM